MGPPMLRKSEGKLLMEINVEELFAQAVLSSALGPPTGETAALEVSYPPSLPHPIEPEALVWDVESGSKYIA
jgi:hypothetical protein